MAERLIAIDTDDEQALAACVRAVGGLAEVIEWAAAGTPAGEVEADLLICDLGGDHAAGIQRYAHIRRARPGLPILLLAAGVQTEIAVELVKLGAQDLLATDVRTGDGEVLMRKAARLLGGPRSPALDDPVFASFKPRDETAEERRRAFRAPVPEALAARIRLRLRPRAVEAAVLDISLETDGFAGAMLVRFPGDAVEPEVFRREELVASSAAAVALPDGGDPVELSVLPVRVRTAASGRTVDVAFQYRPLDPDDASRLARFWMQCQARARSQP